MAKNEAKPKSKNTLMIIVIILVVVLIGLVLAMAYYVFGGENMALGAKDVKAEEAQVEYTVPLEEFVINLKSDGNVQHYAKATIALMYTDEASLDLINANTSKLRDVIIANLRNKTASEMLNNENLTQIKVELVSSLNTALNEEVICDVYFTDLVVQ